MTQKNDQPYSVLVRDVTFTAKKYFLEVDSFDKATVLHNDLAELSRIQEEGGDPDGLYAKHIWDKINSELTPRTINNFYPSSTCREDIVRCFRPVNKESIDVHDAGFDDSHSATELSHTVLFISGGENADGDLKITLRDIFDDVVLTLGNDTLQEAIAMESLDSIHDLESVQDFLRRMNHIGENDLIAPISERDAKQVAHMQMVQGNVTAPTKPEQPKADRGGAPSMN